MTHLTPDQAHLFVHDAILGNLKNESRTTKAVLAAVPNANLDESVSPARRPFIEFNTGCGDLN